MKSIAKFLCLLTLLWVPVCYAVDARLLIDAVENQDASRIIEYFDSVETMTWEEARSLITCFYGHIEEKYGSEIMESDTFAHYFVQLQSLYHSILETNGLVLENGLINTFEDLPSNITLCKKKGPKETVDIPVEIVLGAVEILGGALVWIIPAPQAKVVGASMIGDGIRRTFNGLEEIDKKNQTPH